MGEGTMDGLWCEWQKNFCLYQKLHLLPINQNMVPIFCGVLDNWISIVPKKSCCYSFLEWPCVLLKMPFKDSQPPHCLPWAQSYLPYGKLPLLSFQYRLGLHGQRYPRASLVLVSRIQQPHWHGILAVLTIPPYCLSAVTRHWLCPNALTPGNDHANTNLLSQEENNGLKSSLW